jgi:hypothetical protein
MGGLQLQKIKYRIPPNRIEDEISIRNLVVVILGSIMTEGRTISIEYQNRLVKLPETIQYVKKLYHLVEINALLE